MNEMSLSERLKQLVLLSDREQAETFKEVFRIANQLFGRDKNYRFYRFFADMVKECGEGIRPHVKKLYLGFAATAPDEVVDEMDSVEEVRGYADNTIFPDEVYEKMLFITYPVYGRGYISPVLSIKSSRYNANPKAYEKLTPETLEIILAENNIEEDLERETGRKINDIAYSMWMELVDSGFDDTQIIPWEDDDYENAIYFANLSPEEQEDDIEDSKIDSLDAYMRILDRDWTYHED